MKRDLDLCRHLLAEIEGHGPDCAVTALRPGVTGEAEETVRYHVRLLIDAGLAKEVDRATGGVPCVRLTNAGHELLELAHSETRWREAKWVVGQRTGTQSLTVIRSVLARWAYESAVQGERPRPTRAYLAPREYAPAYETLATPTRRYAYGPTYRPSYHRVEPRYRFERDLDSAEPRPVTAPAVTRAPYSYLERFDWRAPFDWRNAGERDTYYREPLFANGHYHADSYRNGHYREDVFRDGFLRDGELDEIDGVTLPTHVV